MEDLKTALLEKETTSQTPQTIRQEPQTIGENLKVNLTRVKEQSSKLREEPKKQQAKANKVVGKNQINFFGGEYNVETSKQEVQEVKSFKESASVIETPNYDLIEPLTEEQEEKIFKVERQSQAKKKSSPLLKKIKIGIFVLLVGVLGSWTIYNAVELSNIVTEYNLKLDQYLLKLGTLDSASNMNDLFPTYPEGDGVPAGIDKKSNWFDRFCNFIAGIFGG